jgi:adenosylmethionine-8-amino-7-oxononanoate aminotransferase
MQHQGARPLIIERGQGSVVYDVDGRPYLDAAAGLWCVNVGYGHPALIAAGAQQLETLAYYPLTQSHPAAIALAARLAALLPDVPHCYFSNSGSEANEVAFKMVRQYWKQVGRPSKVKVISRHRGYHGSTLGALSATGQAERRRDYEPLAPGFVQVSSPYCFRCPFHLQHPTCAMQCAEDFERRIQIEGPETVAAIIVEPIIAGGGIIVPPHEYLARVAAIARQYEVKLIVDEVVTGFGRAGHWFAHQGYGVAPDVVTMAKGLASGYMPMGATLVSDTLFEAFLGEPDSGRHLRHVNTYGGHPVAAAVSLANIAVIEQEGLVEQSRLRGAALLAQLRERLQDLPFVGDIRGRGLLLGIELVEDRLSSRPVSNQFMRRLARHLLDAGVIAGKATDVEASHNNILMLAPPLVLTESQAQQLVEVIGRALEVVGPAERILS